MLMVEAQIRCSSRMRPDQNWRGRLPQRGAGRPQRAQHQHAPDQQAEEEADLPEPPELDVGESLVAEPEPAVVDIAHDAELVADQRAGDDDAASPRTADRPAIPGRVPPARRRSRARGTAPAPIQDDADPDDRRLDMHVAQEVERQEIVQIADAVEAAPIVVGVGHDRAGGDLQQQHGGDDAGSNSRPCAGSRSAAGTSPAPGPSARRPDGSARTRR